MYAGMEGCLYFTVDLDEVQQMNEMRVEVVASLQNAT
jgi:hypothetical protein